MEHNYLGGTKLESWVATDIQIAEQRFLDVTLGMNRATAGDDSL